MAKKLEICQASQILTNDRQILIPTYVPNTYLITTLILGLFDFHYFL